ncbi:MAG TPA: DinB family protein [Terriglobales bacterium]|nr:DinB family protein [Terriglobales bacterium]
MNGDHLKSIRRHLIDLLKGGNAHIKPEKVIPDFPERFRGTKVAKFPHTAWQLLEHLRIAQGDILEFSRNAKHESPPWPKGYWPKGAEPPDRHAWKKSSDQFFADLKAMEQLVANSSTDLLAKIPHGNGQTILREALVLADHNSYHLGQMEVLRKALEDE